MLRDILLLPCVTNGERTIPFAELTTDHALKYSSLQGTTTVSSIAILFLLARPLKLPGRANIALNCLLGMSAMQVT